MEVGIGEFYEILLSHFKVQVDRKLTATLQDDLLAFKSSVSG